MNTFKTIVVIATLLCVGYGAHVVLNKPIPNGDFATAEAIWNDLPDFSKPEINLGSGSPVADIPPASPQVAADPNQFPPPLAVTPSPSVTHPNQLVSVPSSTVPNPNPRPAETAQSFPQPLPQYQYATPSEQAGSVSSTPLAAIPPLAGETPAGSSTHHLMSANIPSTIGSDFDAVWTSAQTKLQDGSLADALLTLSLFYDDESLDDVQRNQLIPLLDQLAGTVIYSGEHMLDAPYVVQVGETLDSVAQAHAVPAEFLRRVNGLPHGAPLAPGQTIKIVRGPFRGRLSLSRRELTLFLSNYYAGRFSVGIGRDLPAQTSVLQVVEKSGPRPFHDLRTGQQIPAGAPNNPYGNVWIGLRDPSLPDMTALGLHSTGNVVDASDTRGCISVSPEDAGDLVAILALNSTVEIMR